MSRSIESELLSGFPWLAHGFGTRTSPPPELPLALVKQVHSARAVTAWHEGNHGEADAIVTGTSGLAVGVKTADCVPILLIDAQNRAIAAIHAGWRGTVGQIVAETLRLMKTSYGTQPQDVAASIGPGIGKCCFEVGPEVARQFAPWYPEFSSTDQKHHVDLAEVNRRELVRAGVPASQIDVSRLCTVDDRDLLFSYRREREAAGRMLSWVAVRSPQQ